MIVSEDLKLKLNNRARLGNNNNNNNNNQDDVYIYNFIHHHMVAKKIS